jgi:hypothetical protein
MFALLPIATAKAEFLRYVLSALPPKADISPLWGAQTTPEMSTCGVVGVA